jgi:hypothetical protein
MVIKFIDTSLLFKNNSAIVAIIPLMSQSEKLAGIKVSKALIR